MRAERGVESRERKTRASERASEGGREGGREGEQGREGGMEGCEETRSCDNGDTLAHDTRTRLRL